MKLIQKTLVAAAVALSAPAFAAIEPGGAPSGVGNGEMFLVLFNATAEVSLTVDLGEHINNFRAAYDFNTLDTVAKKAWTINSANANVATFVQRAGDASNWGWFVMAADSVGSGQPNARGLLSTLTAGQGKSNIQETPNLSLSAIYAPVDAFLDVTNANGDATYDDFAQNGYTFGDMANGAYALKSIFPGTNGVGNAKWTNDNAVGTSSPLYYVTRSSTSNRTGQNALGDVFDNAYGESSFSLAAKGADYTLTFATATAPIPEPGTYALMLAGLAAVGALARRRRA